MGLVMMVIVIEGLHLPPCSSLHQRVWGLTSVFAQVSVLSIDCAVVPLGSLNHPVHVHSPRCPIPFQQDWDWSTSGPWDQGHLSDPVVHGTSSRIVELSFGSKNDVTNTKLATSV